MLNKDALAGLALLYQALYDGSTGFCGVNYGVAEKMPEVHIVKDELNELFGDSGITPTYEKLEASFGTNYYKCFVYKDVKFFSLVSKEEYEEQGEK